MSTNLTTTQRQALVSGLTDLLAAITGETTTPKEAAVKTTTTRKAKSVTQKRAPKSTKKARTIECQECGVTVKNATWNQKFCAKHSAERQVAFGAWLAETAETRKERSEGNHAAQAWIDEMVEKGKITKPATREARQALWAEVQSGSRNVKHLDKVVRDNLVTDLVPEAPAKTVRPTRKQIDAEVAATDAKNADLIAALVALGHDEDDAIEAVLGLNA